MTEHTLEERYRALCMLMLVFRYGYYVWHAIIISEEQFNVFDRLLRDFEAQFPGIRHPKSPTQTVGSDREEDYPRSVVSIWREHERIGSLNHWEKDIDVLVRSVRTFMEEESGDDGEVTKVLPAQA